MDRRGLQGRHEDGDGEGPERRVLPHPGEAPGDEGRVPARQPRGVGHARAAPRWSSTRTTARRSWTTPRSRRCSRRSNRVRRRDVRCRLRGSPRHGRACRLLFDSRSLSHDRPPHRSPRVPGGVRGRGRRRLLGLAAAPVPRDDLGGFTLGVQSYTFREFDLEQALKRIKDLGLKYAEFYRKHIPPDSTPDKLKAILKLCKEYERHAGRVRRVSASPRTTTPTRSCSSSARRSA